MRTWWSRHGSCYCAAVLAGAVGASSGVRAAHRRAWGQGLRLNVTVWQHAGHIIEPLAEFEQLRTIVARKLSRHGRPWPVMISNAALLWLGALLVVQQQWSVAPSIDAQAGPGTCQNGAQAMRASRFCERQLLLEDSLPNVGRHHPRLWVHHHILHRQTSRSRMGRAQLTN